MTADYITKHFEALRLFRGIKSDIAHLANAFETTGNQKMADDLAAIYDSIDIGMGLFSNAFDDITTQAYNSTREATANMISAALAMATIVEKKNISD